MIRSFLKKVFNVNFIVDKVFTYMVNWLIEDKAMTFNIEESDMPNNLPKRRLSSNDYSTQPVALWTPEDICTRIWTQLCLSPSGKHQQQYLEVFSLFQSDLAQGPDDPNWKKFLDTTPGLRSYLSNINDKSKISQ